MKVGFRILGTVSLSASQEILRLRSYPRLLALASKEIEIVAIVAVFGNTPIDNAYTNVLKTYKALEEHLALHPEEAERFPNFGPKAPKPILIKGPAQPITGESFTAQHFVGLQPFLLVIQRAHEACSMECMFFRYKRSAFGHSGKGRDGLSDITTRHPELASADIHTPEFASRHFVIPDYKGRSTIEYLRDTILELPPRSLSFLTLGPFTTLAHLLKLDEATVTKHIGRVFSMGGAIDEPGNTSPVAEFVSLLKHQGSLQALTG